MYEHHLEVCRLCTAYDAGVLDQAYLCVEIVVRRSWDAGIQNIGILEACALLLEIGCAVYRSGTSTQMCAVLLRIAIYLIALAAVAAM
jgi:hypothetical protein